MKELQIYFAGALRGGASHEDLARRIEFLESIGNVLTKHMASPRTADFGAASDAEIYAHDQRLLEASDVFIADLSSPSTGSGFMAARAVARQLPVLALFRADQNASAMIAGCPEITTRRFASEAEFRDEVREFLLEVPVRFRSRRPKIFLSGPPGSGKGTLGKALAAATGAPHISTGEILRELLAKNEGHPHAAAIAESMKAGRLVDAKIMLDIVLERLRRRDCERFGFILDGYPPSRADLENLTSNDIAPDIVFHLEVSDATSVARQVGRAARSTDTPEKAQKRLEVFHEEYGDWYPDRVVVRVDAEQTADKVEAFVFECVRNMFGTAERSRSFFPLLPFRPGDVRSTRVHFHVDAPDATALREIAREIYVRHRPAQGQMKIYPIDSLYLGPQVDRLPIYKRMPNFHAFENSSTEAFITGRLGDGDDEFLRVVREVSAKHGAMAELESYTGEWTLKVGGAVLEDSKYPLLAGIQSDPDIPTWELHLGFDVPKSAGTGLPLALPTLMRACTEAGLENGGWFIFKNESSWAYRSNEFSSLDETRATEKLFAQARTLAAILAERGIVVDVSFSLERVHGIWT